jgi:hypothetical protein
MLRTMVEHLRPHPASVPVRSNVALKEKFASSNDAFTYAFNKRGYTDFDIYNILKKPTVDRSGVGHAIATSTKPVVFFLCYDVGYSKVLNLFIRHIVCCVAKGKDVIFFDMRDLCDIAPEHQRRIEHELERKSGVTGIKLHNASCFGGKCIYLQRFKGEDELGWCIAWALYFLQWITQHGVPTESSVKKLYTHINKALIHHKSNHPIEEWYVKSYQSLEQ